MTPIRRYIATLVLFGALTFGTVWAYVAALPMAFLPDEYPRWAAKQAMLRACDLGDVLIVGDSRAAVDIRPEALPIRATNLALAGSSTIEAYVTLDRALRCPRLPRLVILSIAPSHFAGPDTFWGKSAKYRFFTLEDLLEIHAQSAALDDWSMYQEDTGDALPPLARTLLYAARFPSVYFASLADAGVFFRYGRNQAILGQVLRSRGQYFFVENEAGSSELAPEASARGFTVKPILDRYFDRMVALLAAKHVPAIFLGMPLNDATAAVLAPSLPKGFAAYLRRYTIRYPGLRVAAQPMPHWPDRFVGDRLAHFNTSGAQRYGDDLKRCLPTLLGEGDEDVAACQSIGYVSRP